MHREINWGAPRLCAQAHRAPFAFRAVLFPLFLLFLLFPPRTGDGIAHRARLNTAFAQFAHQFVHRIFQFEQCQIRLELEIHPAGSHSGNFFRLDGRLFRAVKSFDARPFQTHHFRCQALVRRNRLRMALHERFQVLAQIAQVPRSRAALGQIRERELVKFALSEHRAQPAEVLGKIPK